MKGWKRYRLSFVLVSWRPWERRGESLLGWCLEIRAIKWREHLYLFANHYLKPEQRAEWLERLEQAGLGPETFRFNPVTMPVAYQVFGAATGGGLLDHDFIARIRLGGGDFTEFAASLIADGMTAICEYPMQPLGEDTSRDTDIKADQPEIFVRHDEDGGLQVYRRGDLLFDRYFIVHPS